MTHIVDQVSLGAIVQVRDRLLEQQAKGQKVLRLESGDPSFDIPIHVSRGDGESASRWVDALHGLSRDSASS